MDIILCIFLVFFWIILHELMHIIIFKIQGRKVTGFGFLGINIIEKKLFFSINMLYLIGGYSFIDTRDINHNNKIDSFMKILRTNHFYTIFINFLFFILFLILTTVQYGNSLEKIAIIASLLINGLLLVNAIYSKLGDIRIVFLMKHDNLYLLSYLITSDLMSHFRNEWLYRMSCERLLEINNVFDDSIKKNLIISVISYVLDYLIYNGIENIEVIQHIDQLNIGLPIIIQEYFDSKLLIYYKSINSCSDEKIIKYANKYKEHKYRKFMLNIYDNKSEKILEIIQKKYGIIKYSESIIDYIHNIQNILDQMEVTNEKSTY